MTRLLLLAIAGVGLVGCSLADLESAAPFIEPKIELICLHEFHGSNGSQFATDVGLSVNGRVAYSDVGVRWWWGDTREEIGRPLSDSLSNFTESKFKTILIERGDSPSMPPCVAAKMSGEPCDDCGDDS